MTPTSAIIFSVFGGLWVVFAILSRHSVALPWCVVPIGIAAGLIAWSVSVARTRPPLPAHESSRRNKVIMYATIFECVAFFVGGNVLKNLGIIDQYLPLLAVIVGLHFLPFARYLPDWRYYPIALSLIAIGIAGAIVPLPDVRAWLVCLGSALVLWTASIIALRARNSSA